MPIWIHRTSKGTFWIRPDGSGRITLGVDDEALGSYATPEQAADDVYCCATGYHPWDAQGTVNAPVDLSEWDYRP